AHRRPATRRGHHPAGSAAQARRRRPHRGAGEGRALLRRRPGQRGARGPPGTSAAPWRRRHRRGHGGRPDRL
ncbi:MAG: Uncharacterized protein YbcJ, partial [uncultured Blastococcus sp.]